MEAVLRALVQRVTYAEVIVDGQSVSRIGRGYLIFLGITHADDRAIADRIVKKLTSLRIFPDDDGKINLSLSQVDGELMIVSQFTLYADTSRGNRPGFSDAAAPSHAEALYEYFISRCKLSFPVASGVFGADMKIHLTNDGPFTILLE